MSRLGGDRLQEKAKVPIRKGTKGRIGGWMVVIAQTSVSQRWKLVRDMPQGETKTSGFRSEPCAIPQGIPVRKQYQRVTGRFGVQESVKNIGLWYESKSGCRCREIRKEKKVKE